MPVQEPGPYHDWLAELARARRRALGWLDAQHKPRPAAPLRGGWASRCTRLQPPPPPSLQPHAHARLAVAAGRPPAGLVWGSAGTKWQRLGHLSCHCRKRARKTGAWVVGHLPAALSARARVRNGSPCFYAQGGDSWAAPLSLATLQAEQVGARWGAGCRVRGWRCPELGSWVGSPGLWRRRASHERQKWMPRRVLWVLPNCCVHLLRWGWGAEKTGAFSIPAGPRGLERPQGAESVIPAVTISAPFQARAQVRAQEGSTEGGGVSGCSSPHPLVFTKTWTKPKKAQFTISASVKAKRPNALSAGTCNSWPLPRCTAWSPVCATREGAGGLGWIQWSPNYYRLIIAQSLFTINQTL